MKERVKVKMEKQVNKRSINTPASPANRTKPERSRKSVSFASDLMILANKAAEEDESLPEEDRTYEQALSQGGKPELTIQQRAAKSTAASLNISHRAANVLKEAKLNKGLELYQIYKSKKRANESCTRFLSNNLSATLQHLSFGDLLVLANAAEEYLPPRVDQDTCKQRESGEMDSKGSCFTLSEELQRNQEIMQQKGEAAPVKVVEEVKPNRDPSDVCRKDKLFEKKYVRRKRVKNKEQLESKSVGVVAGTSNLVNKLCSHKPSTFINVDAAEIDEGLLDNSGETQTKSEQGRCNGIRNKTKSRNETEATAAVASRERRYPKRKRSQLLRRTKEPKKSLGESREGKKQACDQIDTCDISGQKAETEKEEEDVSDASNSSSCNMCTSFIFNVQWSNKRKRNCMKLEEAQSNRMILLIAVEAITHQLRFLDISI